MKKIIQYENLDQDLKRIRKGKLVLTGGCFDILHKGHIEFLKEAKKLGDILLVMLESDESVTARKGKDRPANSAPKRAHVLATLKQVDHILLLPFFKTDLEYYNLVKKLQPDIIAVTQNDPAYNKKVEQAEMVGGKVVEVIKRLPHSTTDLIEKL